jgi:hypothetical protein
MVYVYTDQNKYYEKIKEKKNAKCMEKYYKNNVKCACGLREKSKDHEHSSKHNEYLFKEKLKIHLGKDDVDSLVHMNLWRWTVISSKINQVARKKYEKIKKPI